MGDTSKTPPERKKIEELIQRYRREPSIRDVFVEGRSDAAVLKKFINTQKLKDVAVYEISTVEIPASALAASAQPDAVRGRVIYLALEFEKSLPSTSNGVSCVADRDYDLVLGRAYSSPFLLFVDYCCIEMYAFDASVMDNMLAAIAPAIAKNGEQVLKELEPTLRRLFLIRAANIALGFNMKWLQTVEDSCALKQGIVQFDEQDFMQRYLGKNARLADIRRFTEKVAEFETKTRGDARLFIRGHDFARLLSWYLREHSSKTSRLHKEEVVEQLMLAHLETSVLAKQKFFVDLVKRTNSPQ
jgi:hypothetical protein